MDRSSVPQWKRLLQRKTDEHFRRFHADVANVSRRGFLASASGAAGLAFVSELTLPPFALAEPKTAEPKPIPGGATAFGFLVHHNPMPTSPIPLDQISDPSEIGDFNGTIIDTQIRGLGTGTGLSTPVSFRADMGAMQGEYVGEDGKHHHGSFVFIWLDIYASGTVGFANPLQQIHDYSPGTAPNGLFWVIPTSPDSIEVDFDAGLASLRLRDVPVMDAHDLLNNLTNGQGFPSMGVPPIAPVPATVSFDIEWSGIVDSSKVVNVMQNFRGQFLKTGATINWSAESAGFSFQSEPPDPSRNLYSVIGHEQNGVYFHLEGNEG